jgi:tripartite-type tricarboxylate transporter receptor subunit TctC
VSDLAGGQIAAVMGPGDFLSYYKAGKLRVLATSGPQRNPYLPNVPTFAEQGFADLTAEEWFGFYANAKTPADVRARAHAAIAAALKSEALKESVGVVGLIATSSTPEEMARSQQAEFERWGPLVSRSALRLIPDHPEPLCGFPLSLRGRGRCPRCGRPWLGIAGLGRASA